MMNFLMQLMEKKLKLKYNLKRVIIIMIQMIQIQYFVRQQKIQVFELQNELTKEQKLQK